MVTGWWGGGRTGAGELVGLVVRRGSYWWWGGILTGAGEGVGLVVGRWWGWGGGGGGVRMREGWGGGVPVHLDGPVSPWAGESLSGPHSLT